MELVEIEKLLEAYFEGKTSLEDEKSLRGYFNSKNVDEQLQQYKPIFMGFQAATEERTEREYRLPQNNATNLKYWMYSVAAMLVVLLAIGSFYVAQPQMSHEEQQALAAFKKSKEAMLLLSENLNKGAEQLVFVEQFEETKDEILK